MHSTKHSRVVPLALAIALFAGVLSPAARAQTVDTEALKNKAEEQIRNRLYRDAVATYLKAYDASKDEKFLFNVSILFLKTLDDPLSAWKYAVRFKEAAKSESTRAHADQLFRMVEEKLIKKRVKVVVSATPSDAALWMDYKSPQTELKAGIVWVKPGAHKVIGWADGFVSQEREFTATMGSTAVVELSLAAAMATIQVSSNVRGTSVYVDTVKIGLAPIRKEMRPGTYRIRAEAPGYRPLENELTLKAGDTRSLKAKLVLLDKATTTPTVTLASKGKLDGYRKGAYATFAIGGASLATGVVLAVLGYLDVKEAGSLSRAGYPGGDEEYESKFYSLRDSGQAKGYAGYGMLGVGVAALGTGIILWVLSDDKGTAVIPSGPGGPGLTASMRF